MKFDREARIWTLLIIDVIFCIVELVTGTMAHSLALIADSFHMINDVVSLIIALYAIKASRRPASNLFSYAWARAEVLGAFANAVFLIALCFSIALEAIQRFVEVQEVGKPLLMTIVGSLGLASNVIGLFLFHEHGHSHGGHSHSHSEVENAQAPLITSDSNSTDPATNKRTRSSSRRGQGRERSDSFSSLYGHPAATRAAVIEVAQEYGYGKHDKTGSASADRNGILSPTGFSPTTNRGESFDSAMTGGGGGAGSHSRGKSAGGLIRTNSMPTHNEDEEEHGHQHSNGEEHGHNHDHDEHNHAGHSHSHSHTESNEEDDVEGKTSGSSSTVIAATSTDSKIKKVSVHAHSHDDGHDHGDDGHGHGHGHSHGGAEKKSAGGGGHGHGHSHGGSMNIRGVFLHVLGDALGNIGVIAAGLVILLCHGSWRFYFDPAISLCITCIIFSSALPLCKSAAFILLQGVPTHISLEDVRESIREVEGVLSLHELHIWQLSEKTVVASVHVLVSKDQDYMIIANGIREALHAHGVHSSTIQPEFGDADDGTLDGDACLIRCPPETCDVEVTCCPPVGKLVDVADGEDATVPPPTGANAV